MRAATGRMSLAAFFSPPKLSRAAQAMAISDLTDDDQTTEDEVADGVAEVSSPHHEGRDGSEPAFRRLLPPMDLTDADVVAENMASAPGPMEHALAPEGWFENVAGHALGAAWKQHAQEADAAAQALENVRGHALASTASTCYL